MADVIGRIRAQDEYCEFYDMATQIRNQKLLTDAELNSLNRHQQEVTDAEIKLLTEAWKGSCWNNIVRLLRIEKLDPSVSCRLLKNIDETVALPAYKHVGHYFSYLAQLLSVLYEKPDLVADLLNSVDQNDVSSNDCVIQVFFQLIYSCGLYPEDELKLARVVCYLLKVQLLKSGSEMRKMLRKETSMSTRFYKHFVEFMHPSMVYLTKALRKSVLDVIQLGSFWLDIDAKQSKTRYLRDNKQNADRLPEYRALVVSKIVELVDTFLENIAQALPMLPPNLNWIVRDVFCYLYEVVDDVSAVEVSHACKDMIVSNLICPAIISPQKYGIVDNNVKIGSIVNHNLVQIAMIIQIISLREFEAPPEEYQEFLSQCTKTHLISDMMDALLIEQSAPDVEITSLFANESAQSDQARKTSFVGSIADVNVLVNLVRSANTSSVAKISSILNICEKLPETVVSINQKTKYTSSEVSPKVSTFRNIHRKVQHSLKRSTESSSNNSVPPCLVNEPLFEKENFELFFLEYLPQSNLENTPKLFEAPHLFDFSQTEVEDNDKEKHGKDEDEAKMEKRLSNAPKEKAQTIEIIQHASSQLASPESSANNITSNKSQDTLDSKRGLSKFKGLSDKMKKGLAQSNTLSDIREHLRRSGNSLKQGLAPSNSEQLLSEAMPGPRDDILEKYASIPAIRKEKAVLTNFVEIENKSMYKERVEPYYSSDDIVTCRAFQDTLRKMLTVLGNVSYLPRIGYRNKKNAETPKKKHLLDRFLDGVLVETEHRREYGQAAQLREVKRCIELFENAGVEILIDHIKQKDSEQENVISNMRKERTSLMRKLNDMSSLEQRVLLNRLLTEEVLVDFLMRTFLETGFYKQHAIGKTPEVAAVLKFYEEFKSLQAHDERAEFLQNLLRFLKERLMQNHDWNFASPSMIERAMTTIERYVMFSVYDLAFYPNREVDHHRDKLLRGTIAKVMNIVTPGNDSLKIPEHLLGEAPWPSAQAELSMLDVYVTAQEKLNCIVRCCDVINNLIALSSKNAVASADDLTPVLVFVIIKANPRSLLSNLQFVETFAGDKIESGRDAYYWINFKSAVEYIKTIL
ncbi:unnamed protein product [Caenorhabditis sp. 36 PRJEB53466]|nr:unnamed protein product [Caenorhabditis sp. 36 PRJEB53466]